MVECFRIFVDPSRTMTIPAGHPFARGLNLNPQTTTSVYTDGACWNNGKADARSGSGIWIGPGHQKNTAIRIPGPKQSNQVGEIAAVIGAATSIPNFLLLKIITDSQYVIDGLTKHLKHWEDDGWIGIDNAEFFKQAVYLLKKRTVPTTFQWVKGHDGNLGNEESDALAKEGANKDAPDLLSLEIPRQYNLQGAKLATLSQAVAYRGIQIYNKPTPQPATNRNLEMIRQSIQIYQGSLEMDKTIWKNLRKCTIWTRVQQFLFKAIHNTPMVGEVWFHIQHFEQHGVCKKCNTTESMEHILTKSSQGTATRIWKMTKDAWDHERYKWPEISLGIVMGCGNLSAQKHIEHNAPRDQWQWHQTTTNQRGATRLQILILEAAHLIWVMRCERVIQEKSHTNREIQARWLKAINQRLMKDKITATKIKRDKTFIKLIKSTWENLLTKHLDPPTDWIQNSEVLVGMRAYTTLPARRPTL